MLKGHDVHQLLRLPSLAVHPDGRPDLDQGVDHRHQRRMRRLDIQTRIQRNDSMGEGGDRGKLGFHAYQELVRRKGPAGEGAGVDGNGPQHLE